MLMYYFQDVCQDLKQYSELSCSSTSLIEVIATNFKGDHEDSEKKKIWKERVFLEQLHCSLSLKEKNEETSVFYFE